MTDSPLTVAAYAKVNLSLRVGAVRSDGFHPLTSLFQSVSLCDDLQLMVGEPDGITGWDGEPVPDDHHNLAWRAVLAIRAAANGEARPDPPLKLRLRKRIPVAAGLGGGSADAAAGLQVAARLLGVTTATVTNLAPTLGSDVPFCAVGGTAMVTGRGENLHPRPPLDGFALALVVPPVELSTPAVFRTWDELGGPSGTEIPAGELPPQLREYTPLANDLYPAAVKLSPLVEDWREELSARFGRVVAMSGSGPTLMAWFIDRDEAESAIGSIPSGARAAHAVVPVRRGWEWLNR